LTKILLLFLLHNCGMRNGRPETEDPTSGQT